MQGLMNWEFILAPCLTAVHDVARVNQPVSRRGGERIAMALRTSTPRCIHGAHFDHAHFCDVIDAMIFGRMILCASCRMTPQGVTQDAPHHDSGDGGASPPSCLRKYSSISALRAGMFSQNLLWIVIAGFLL